MGWQDSSFFSFLEDTGRDGRKKASCARAVLRRPTWHQRYWVMLLLSAVSTALSLGVPAGRPGPSFLVTHWIHFFSTSFFESNSLFCTPTLGKLQYPHWSPPFLSVCVHGPKTMSSGYPHTEKLCADYPIDPKVDPNLGPV